MVTLDTTINNTDFISHNIHKVVYFEAAYIICCTAQYSIHIKHCRISFYSSRDLNLSSGKGCQFYI